MRRTLTLLTVFALLIGVLAIPATASGDLGEPTYTEVWDGRGIDSEKCELVGEEGRTEAGWIHWVFSTKGASTDARLTLGGTGSGIYEPGEPLTANTWHFYTPYFELEGLTATISVYGGEPDTSSPGGGLVISDYCPGTPQGEITITKTADPSFTRTHEWDIEKSVDTENELELEDGTPKVWLYTDGSGDETATWTVDVTYDGYEDTGHALSGSVTIENTGDLDANITNLVDTYGGAPVIFDCKVDDVPFIFGQTLLAPEEVLVCTYEVDPANEELLENTVRVGGTFSDGTTFNETDTATYDWDTPTTEVNKTVNIKDISDLFGEVDLGTVTAPSDGKFTYTEDFAWEDYGQALCGSYTYDNTATIVQTGQSASATLKVNVQCYLWESAWAKADEGAVAFCDTGFANWGWTNELTAYSEGEWPLYAGAGQCDLEKGMLVGSFAYTYAEGSFTHQFTPAEDILFEGEAVYADTARFPTLRNGRDTTAPGQYYVADPIPGPPIHVIAHVNAGIPDPHFGP